MLRPITLPCDYFQRIFDASPTTNLNSVSHITPDLSRSYSFGVPTLASSQLLVNNSETQPTIDGHATTTTGCWKCRLSKLDGKIFKGQPPMTQPPLITHQRWDKPLAPLPPQEAPTLPARPQNLPAVRRSSRFKHPPISHEDYIRSDQRQFFLFEFSKREVNNSHTNKHPRTRIGLRPCNQNAQSSWRIILHGH